MHKRGLPICVDYLTGMRGSGMADGERERRIQTKRSMTYN